jgi:hypothetical protein
VRVLILIVARHQTASRLSRGARLRRARPVWLYGVLMVAGLVLLGALIEMSAEPMPIGSFGSHGPRTRGGRPAQALSPPVGSTPWFASRQEARFPVL